MTDQHAETDPTTPQRKRIAVIFPHPDDAEFLCAGTVARWVNEGHEIVYVLLTSGDKGSDDPSLTSDQLVEIREAEQRAACELLGVREIIFLRFPDASLVPDLSLRRALTRVIRQLRPDAVVCFDPTVRWISPNYIQHPDHIAAGEAVLAAIFPSARDRRTFPELLAEGLEPHKVSEIYLAAPREPDTWIDVSPYMDLKIASLKAHASQVGTWDFEEIVRTWAKDAAAGHDGMEYAETFKYLKLD